MKTVARKSVKKKNAYVIVMKRMKRKYSVVVRNVA